ncbi:MAG: glutamyl-tRNA reductase, partial [Acidimicrobiales bacterium]
MPLVVVGLHQRSVPLDLLERVAVGADKLPKALGGLRSLQDVSEVVLLSTCMRTEVYAVVEEYHPSQAEVRDFLAAWAGLAPEALTDHLYGFWGRAAARHLFRVASGLDSAVLGEGEVLAQVRGAWEGARTEGVAGPLLSGLFRHAIEVGKRARTETGIARGTTSLSTAAVAMAQARL